MIKRPSASFIWAVCVVALPVIGAVWKDVAFGTFVLVVLFAATLIHRMENVLEFSIGPLSAKMRERLREADEIIGRLKSLAMLSAKGLLNSSISTGRWSDPDRTWMLNIRNQVRDELLALGFSEAEVADAESYWRGLVAVDFVGIIAGGSTAPVSSEGEVMSERQRLRNCRPPADPEALREFLAKNGWLDNEKEKWITAYSKFLKSGEIDQDANPFLKEEVRPLGRR